MKHRYRVHHAAPSTQTVEVHLKNGIPATAIVHTLEVELVPIEHDCRTVSLCYVDPKEIEWAQRTFKKDRTIVVEVYAENETVPPAHAAEGVQ